MTQNSQTTGKCNCVGCSSGERCTKEIRIDIQPGKRWWEVLFDEDYPFGIYRSAESENPFMRSSVKLDNCKKELKSFIAKVADKEYDRGYGEAMDYVKIIEEQAFRKGVEASLGKLPKENLGLCDRLFSKAKENIGRLLK